MVKIYLQRIRDGKMSLEEVPRKWREQVRKLLESSNN